MLCYFLIYYSNITFKCTKQVQFFIIITVSLLAVIFINSILVYGNILLAPEINCIETTSSIMMDDYVRYIRNSLISDLHQEFNSLNPEQGLCIEQITIVDQSFSFLPGLIYEFRDLIQLQLSSISAVEIVGLFYKPSLLFVLFTLILIGITLKSIWRTESKRSTERKGFTQLIRSNVLKKQDNKCDHCRKILTVVDFHHKNGDRSDNRQKNCQALCPNCHAIETRGLSRWM
jgi:hypothetical protein